MKFQAKMQIVYVILGILTASVAGSIYYFMSMAKINEKEKQSLSISVKQLKLQYDEMIQSMEDVSHYLLSDGETLEAITAISRMERSAQNNHYFVQAENVISSQENSDYLLRKFYRVIFCNDNCAPIANNNLNNRKIRSNIDYKEMPWYEKAKANPDTFTIVGIHKDNWGELENPEVFSVIKRIQGGNRGYIEVQKSLEDIQNKLQTADAELNICIINDEGEILYQNMELDMAFCKSLLHKNDIPADEFKGSKGERYLAAGEYDRSAGTMVLVYKDRRMVWDNDAYIVYMSFFIIGGMLMFSFLYTMVSTKRLVKPMLQLQKAIQNTSLETLDQPMDLDFKDDSGEFQRMGQVYENMRKRLYKAILREQQLSTLQLQAQFDMLQAQVNPHFIYNVLNVISSRGILNNDEVICDMCDDLAGMLRYSTDTKEKYATLKEEINYLELYFSLLKYRYRHKLEYKIVLENAVEDQVLPKLVIQQLVENSISHGFKKNNRVMEISVTGYEESGRWYIRVSDSGDGFSAEIQKKLEEQMERLKEELSAGCQNVEMQIGGMGILNTFSRLYLMEPKSIIFEISNKAEGGAEIVISAAMR